MTLAAQRSLLAQRLRLVIIAFCAVISVAQEHPYVVVPGALLLALLETVGRNRLSPVVQVGLVSAVSTATVAASAAGTDAGMPLLLLGAFHAAEALGTRALVIERLATATGLLAWLAVARDPALVANTLVPLVDWTGLGVALGLLVRWNRAVEPPPVTEHAMAREAARLAGRLQRLARELPLGLDAPDVARTLLDEVHAVLEVDVCAVILRVDDQTASPLALRGAQRLPWRDPARATGVLHEAWVECEIKGDVRTTDGPDGRRKGSALLCVPILGARRTMIAMLILERKSAVEYTANERVAAEHAASWVGPQLEAALHFGSLQRASSVDERERLASEMHDGVAQDLAYIGFRLDHLAATAAPQPELSQQLKELRSEVGRVLTDTRLSISDLRLDSRPDEGLGRTLSTMLQRFGATTGCSVQVELHESTFRLPSSVETGLARLAHDLLLDARSGGAGMVTAVLRSDPPTGTLVLDHDGSSTWDETDNSHARLLGQDAKVLVQRRVGEKGLRLVVSVGGANALLDTGGPTPRALELQDGSGAVA